MTEITDFGSIKKIVAPTSWKKIIDEPVGIGTRQSEYFHPPEDLDVNITAFYRGVPVDDRSADALMNLLGERFSNGSSRQLKDDEIRALATVMGFSTVGDNQYTNTASAGQRDYPVFNMTRAELCNLQNRTVLKCRGNFQNEHGVPGTEYEGYFFPALNNARVIEELYFQAPTKGKFLRFSTDFEKCINTLEWA